MDQYKEKALAIIKQFAAADEEQRIAIVECVVEMDLAILEEILKVAANV